MVNTERTLPWERQQAPVCYVPFVSLQFLKGIGGDSAHHGYVLLCLRPESLYPNGQKDLIRRQQVPVVLRPLHLIA